MAGNRPRNPLTPEFFPKAFARMPTDALLAKPRLSFDDVIPGRYYLGIVGDRDRTLEIVWVISKEGDIITYKTTHMRMYSGAWSSISAFRPVQSFTRGDMEVWEPTERWNAARGHFMPQRALALYDLAAGIQTNNNVVVLEPNTVLPPELFAPPPHALAEAAVPVAPVAAAAAVVPPPPPATGWFSRLFGTAPAAAPRPARQTRAGAGGHNDNDDNNRLVQEMRAERARDNLERSLRGAPGPWGGAYKRKRTTRRKRSKKTRKN